jgi:hypothetical protein
MVVAARYAGASASAIVASSAHQVTLGNVAVRIACRMRS